MMMGSWTMWETARDGAFPSRSSAPRAFASRLWAPVPDHPGVHTGGSVHSREVAAAVNSVRTELTSRWSLVASSGGSIHGAPLSPTVRRMLVVASASNLDIGCSRLTSVCERHDDGGTPAWQSRCSGLPVPTNAHRPSSRSQTSRRTGAGMRRERGASPAPAGEWLRPASFRIPDSAGAVRGALLLQLRRGRQLHLRGPLFQRLRVRRLRLPADALSALRPPAPSRACAPSAWRTSPARDAQPAA